MAAKEFSRNRIEIRLWRAVHLVPLLGVWKLDLRQTRLKLISDGWKVRRRTRLDQADEIAHQLFLVAIIFDCADGNPNIREGNLTQEWHIGDYADHAEVLAISLNGF